jgi:hypothetical protein
MAQKRFLSGMAVRLVFWATILTASCGSAPQYRPSPDMPFGEREPLLAGTTWIHQGTNTIYQLKAGGELVRQGLPYEDNWSRDGDSVKLSLQFSLIIQPSVSWSL